MKRFVAKEALVDDMIAIAEGGGFVRCRGK